MGAKPVRATTPPSGAKKPKITPTKKFFGRKSPVTPGELDAYIKPRKLDFDLTDLAIGKLQKQVKRNSPEDRVLRQLSGNVVTLREMARDAKEQKIVNLRPVVDLLEPIVDKFNELIEKLPDLFAPKAKPTLVIGQENAREYAAKLGYPIQMRTSDLSKDMEKGAKNTVKTAVIYVASYGNSPKSFLTLDIDGHSGAAFKMFVLKNNRYFRVATVHPVTGKKMRS